MVDNERADAIPSLCILAEGVVQNVASNHEWLGFRLLAYVVEVQCCRLKVTSLHEFLHHVLDLQFNLLRGLHLVVVLEIKPNHVINVD